MQKFYSKCNLNIILILGFGGTNGNIFLALFEDTLFPFIRYCRIKEVKEDVDIGAQQKVWSKRTNINSIIYFGLLFTLAILNVVYTFMLNGYCDEKVNLENGTVIIKEDEACENATNSRLDVLIFKEGLPASFLQYTSVYLQLMIIVGLCFDGGQSLVSKFFRTKTMKFLGRISMALYLIHEPLIYWIKFIINGQQNWVDGKKIETDFSFWAVPIHLAVSLAFGTILTLYFEEPCRRILKKCIDKSNQNVGPIELTVKAS